MLTLLFAHPFSVATKAHTFFTIGLMFNSLLLKTTVSDGLSWLSDWFTFNGPASTLLSNHEIRLSGTNCGTGTPKTFLLGVIGSVVSVGNWSKFIRNADTCDKSSSALFPSKYWLRLIIGWFEFDWADGVCMCVFLLKSFK